MSLVEQIVSLCITLENIKNYAQCLHTKQYMDTTKDVLIVRLTRQWIIFMELTGAAPSEWDNFEMLMTLGRYDTLVNLPESVIKDVAAKLPADCQDTLRMYAASLARH